MWSRFAVALSFLSLLKVPFTPTKRLTQEELAASFSAFPLAGLVMGTLCAVAAWALSRVMPPLLLGACVTAAMAILTRGLHLDGLADFADGAGGGYTPERRLEIMKDSRTGAFGAVAIALAVLLKTAALQAVLAGGHFAVLAVVPALSRTAMAGAAFRIPYARKEGGLGRSFLEGMKQSHLTTAAVLAGLIAFALTPRLLPALAVAVVAVVFIIRRLAMRLLGGITGDVLGAVNETAEIVCFTVAACILHS